MSTGGDTRAIIQPPLATTTAATAVASVTGSCGTVAGGGGGSGTVYGCRPIDNDNTGSATGSIVRTPVGRGARGDPQEIASCARAPTETGSRQSTTVVGIGIATPVPHRPVSRTRMSVPDLHGSSSPSDGNMAVVVEPPTTAAATAATAATPVAPVAGSRGTAARAEGGSGGSDGGGGGAVYRSRPADNDSTGIVTRSIARTPVGRGTPRHPQEIAACARASTETGRGQSIAGVGIITPVPHRPLSQHWVQVVDLERGYSPPGGDMAVIAEPLPTTAPASAATPGRGSRDTAAGVGHGSGGGGCGGGSRRHGGGGGGRRAVGRGGGRVGGGVCGGGGGSGGSGGGGSGGGGDRNNNGGLEQARLGAPPGFEGIARACFARVGSQQGGIRSHMQEIPLLTTEDALGNTAGATVFSLPRHGDYYPARGCDAMRGRVIAEQRVQLIRQSERLQRQGIRLQLQDAKLELQRRQLQRQRVQLGRQSQDQPLRQGSQAAPLVFWGPGGLLMPVS